MYVDPAPEIKENQLRIRQPLYQVLLTPPSVKNFSVLAYRYLDPVKEDDMWLYVPALRRTLRAEAGQRSTPVQGLIQAPDDYVGGWNAKPSLFTYEFVGEQKMLILSDLKIDIEKVRKTKYEEVYFHEEGWEVRDCYIIDITPKDPKYPQSKKRLYMDKEATSMIAYTDTWDRAGQKWKWFGGYYEQVEMADGVIIPLFAGMCGQDVQVGVLFSNIGKSWPNGAFKKQKLADYSVSNLRRRAR